MADVTALFAARKSKKKKKKGNANTLLQKEKAFDLEEDKFDTEEQYDGPGSLHFTALSDEEEQANWVDDEEDDIPSKEQKFLLSGKGTKEVLDLDSLKISEKEAEPITEEAEVIKKEFHRARQQALTAPSESKKEEKEGKPEKRVYRPRHIVEQKRKESGEHVLKNMDNEEYFPSLGGSKPAKKGHITPGAAWGKVDPVVQKELEEKEKSTTPIYLNADFIPAENFEGAKPGYKFTDGDQGLGYYWEAVTEANEETSKIEESQEVADKIATKTDAKAVETTSEKSSHKEDESANNAKKEPETTDTNTKEKTNLDKASHGKKSQSEAEGNQKPDEEDEIMAELAELKKKKKKKKKAVPANAE